MRIGVIIALRAERCGLLKAPVGDSGESFAPMVAISGIGAHRAIAAAEGLLQQGADALLSWGSAGALAEHISPGTLLLPRQLIEPTGRCRYVDPQWHSHLSAKLMERFAVCTEALTESPVVVCREEQKRALGHVHSAAAVDMESVALARFATERGIPFAALRAIADPVSLSLPAYLGSAINARGRVGAGTVLSQALRRPQDWATLVRVGRNFQAARRTLAAAAEHLAPLLQPQQPQERLT